MPTLRVGEKAYYDTFRGLVLCLVTGLSGSAAQPTSSVKVDFEVLEDKAGYRKGEKLQSSSLWVAPVAAINRRRYSTTIGHYTVEAPCPDVKSSTSAAASLP